jgi:hypothetical protein
MSDQALVIRNDAVRGFSFTPAAFELRDKALACGALVNRVANADDQKAAVAAQLEVATVLKLAESARQTAKEPVLDFGRLIDSTTKKFVVELKEEELRLARLVSDFQQLEQAKLRAAQQAENERLAKIERERAAEMAKAQSHAELDKIAEKFDQKAKDEAPIVFAPARVEGQRVKEDWNFEVTDIWTLARAHPMCVEINPRRSEIKALLNAGHKVAGVRSWKETKASVSVKTNQAIEV